MSNNKFFSYTGVIGASMFVLTTIIGGYFFEGYSHISQYISESYAFGTEYGHLMRWLGYIPSGLLMAAFCFLKAKHFRNSKNLFYGFIGFGIFYGVFTSLVSVFPCDFGCNRNYSESSISQLLHTILSLFTYTLTPVSLYLIGTGFKKIDQYKNISNVSIVLGIFGLIFGMIFLKNANSPVAGLLQRNTEAVYLFWLFFYSWFIIKKELIFRPKTDSNQ
jgi:hypothetical protein